MRKTLLFILVSIFISLSTSAQVSVVKMLGKEGEKTKLGFGVFCTLMVPVNEIGNRHVTIELADISYFPPKDAETNNSILGHLSIKAGFRNIFNSEGATGFFLEPQVGYCRVVKDAIGEATHKDGFAAAIVGGYNLEVGQRGSALNFGIKYESDMAGVDYSIQTISFRFLYSFNMFGSRSRD